MNTCEDVEVPMCATLGYNHTNVKLSPFKFNSQKEAAMGTVYRLTLNYGTIYGFFIWNLNLVGEKYYLVAWDPFHFRWFRPGSSRG